MDEDRHAAFSYCEKGASAPGRPTIVFVHGLSSNKETFTPIIKVKSNQTFTRHIQRKIIVTVFVEYRQKVSLYNGGSTWAWRNSWVE